MKRFFKKLLGVESAEKVEEEKRSKYMPSESAPIEEQFTVQFTNNGGKFLYCETTEEAFDAFQSILEENNWENPETLCFSDALTKHFEKQAIKPTKSNLNATLFLAGCEYLVAQTGGILISANQIKTYKLADLPRNFVIYATTSQLVDSLSQGLSGIKHQYPNNIPSNITNIKHFEKEEQEDNFLSYGSSTKNLYLILLEDL